MDLPSIESVFRLIITAEFGFMALVGAALSAHTISLDIKLRQLAKDQQAIVDGMKDGLDARKAAQEAKRLEREEKEKAHKEAIRAAMTTAQ